MNGIIVDTNVIIDSLEYVMFENMSKTRLSNLKKYESESKSSTYIPTFVINEYALWIQYRLKNRPYADKSNLYKLLQIASTDLKDTNIRATILPQDSEITIKSMEIFSDNFLNENKFSSLTINDIDLVLLSRKYDLEIVTNDKLILEFNHHIDG